MINVCITDVQKRSQTLYTAPCNGVVSHGAQIGGLPVFANHTRKKQMCPRTSRIVRHFMHAHLHGKPQLMQVAYAPDEPWLFWLQEKPEDPQFEAHAGSGIFLVYLWLHTHPPYLHIKREITLMSLTANLIWYKIKADDFLSLLTNGMSRCQRSPPNLQLICRAIFWVTLRSFCCWAIVLAMMT